VCESDARAPPPCAPRRSLSARLRPPLSPRPTSAPARARARATPTASSTQYAASSAAASPSDAAGQPADGRTKRSSYRAPSAGEKKAASARCADSATGPCTAPPKLHADQRTPAIGPADSAEAVGADGGDSCFKSAASISMVARARALSLRSAPTPHRTPVRAARDGCKKTKEEK